MADALTAAARLEAAVASLAHAMERRPPATGDLSREAVAALSARLDAALARLRIALREPDAPEGEA